MSKWLLLEAERVFKEIPGGYETTVGCANGRVGEPEFVEVILELLKSHKSESYHSRS